MGMIQAVTIGSEMLATAKRQALAQQILDHEMEKLRLSGWSTVSGLSSTGASAYTSDLAALNSAIAASGVTFNLSRSVATLTTDLVEVTFTVTWTKGGTTTAASTPTGSWLQQLSFYRESPVARTYTRKSTTWFGKYGLNQAAQRS
jgi:hypothetical protein